MRESNLCRITWQSSLRCIPIGLSSSPEPQQRFGERWMVEDDLRLRERFLEGTTIAQLAKEFNRTQGAIKARLKKFGLIE
jgi:hypothetical protein